MSLRHFLTLSDLTKQELENLIKRACELRKMQHAGEIYQPFVGRTLGMIFEKSSTRTRISFETGMGQFGGSAIFLSPNDTQLGRGEPLEDSARVISSMVDIIMIRTFGHEKVETFAEYSSVPIINALTDEFHPCQLLADMQTYYEHRGSIENKIVTWVGDGNNMCASYMQAANQFGFELRVAAPYGFEPDPELMERFSHCVSLVEDVQDAAKDSNLSSPMFGQVWGKSLNKTLAHAVLRPIKSRHHCLIKLTPKWYLCTAYLRIAAKKSLTICSMIHAQWFGTKRKTACMRKKP